MVEYFLKSFKIKRAVFGFIVQKVCFNSICLSLFWYEIESSVPVLVHLRSRLAVMIWFGVRPVHLRSGDHTWRVKRFLVVCLVSNQSVIWF